MYHQNFNETIYVYLLNEGSASYRPVPACLISENIYIIGGSDIYDSEIETWEFTPGMKVKTEEKKLFDSSKKVAIFQIK